jgi:hypothetical protein
MPVLLGRSSLVEVERTSYSGANTYVGESTDCEAGRGEDEESSE